MSTTQIPQATGVTPADTPALGRRRGSALLSAHKAACAQTGTAANTWDSLTAAVQLAHDQRVDYVEIDVHRTSDGHLVIQHDQHLRPHRTSKSRFWRDRGYRFTDLTRAQSEDLLGRDLVSYEDALRLFAVSDVKVHLDYKFTSPAPMYAAPAEDAYEVQAAAMALSYLGSPDKFILTTMEDQSVRAMRDWADQHSPGTLVGLSLGRDLTTLNPIPQVRLRLTELFPTARVLRSRANLIVANHVLADARLLGWAHRHHMPVLVWTVDSISSLNRFLADPRVWMVTSNHPGRAQAS